MMQESTQRTSTGWMDRWIGWLAGWLVGSISLNLWYCFRLSGFLHFKYLYAIIHVAQLSMAFGFRYDGYSFISCSHFVWRSQLYAARYNIYGYRFYSRHFIDNLFLDTHVQHINARRTDLIWFELKTSIRCRKLYQSQTFNPSQNFRHT